MTGPVRPYSIESMQAPIEPDRAGTANGDTNRGPFVVVDVGPVDDLLDPAAAGVHDDADPVALLLATSPRSRCPSRRPPPCRRPSRSG